MSDFLVWCIKETIERERERIDQTGREKVRARTCGYESERLQKWIRRQMETPCFGMCLPCKWPCRKTNREVFVDGLTPAFIHPQVSVLSLSQVRLLSPALTFKIKMILLVKLQEPATVWQLHSQPRGQCALPVLLFPLPVARADHMLLKQRIPNICLPLKKTYM